YTASALPVHMCVSSWLPFFFFSSRRRHTRWPRDWSSDVCSSDLDEPPAGAPEVSLGDGWSQSDAALSAAREREFEQHLYVARKEIERRLMDAGITSCYIPSFSSRNIVYKGLLSPSQLGVFYRDLADPEFV